MEHFYDEDDDVNDMYWQPRSRNDIGQPQQPRFEHAADIGVPVPSGSDVYGRGAPRPSNLLPHASVMESLLTEPEHVADGARSLFDDEHPDAQSKSFHRMAHGTIAATPGTPRVLSAFLDGHHAERRSKPDSLRLGPA